MDYIAILKAGAVITGGVLSQLLGGFDKMLQVLLVMTAIDILTGLLSAAYHKELNSSVGFRGLVRKAGIYIIVALAHMIDVYIGAELLRGGAIGFYVAMEGISILENWGKMELPMPAKIREVLEQVRDHEHMKEVPVVVYPDQDPEKKY